MSKANKSPNKAERREQREKRKKAYWELQQIGKEQGLKPFAKTTIINSINMFKTVEEETAERQEVIEGFVKVISPMLPTLFKEFAKIEDPRKPNKIKHKLTVLLLYGILLFVFMMTSRREGNRIIAMPMFKENLRLLFPDIETIPHGDTLERLLCLINVEKIEEALVNQVRKLIKNKKFGKYLVGCGYMVAIDGTQKFARNQCLADEYLSRHIKGQEEDQYQYYVYILEATLVFPNGLRIPLISEFLEYTENEEVITKQDCELKAFYRLAKRLKAYFPKLSITILLDGLYPNGPVISACCNNNWGFMIVLQDKSLKTVWEEAIALHKINDNKVFKNTWGDRHQSFWWVNGIEYYYGENGRNKHILNLVVCEEEWKEVSRKSGMIEEINSRHAWLSSKPITRTNVLTRCNLVARNRWGIESNILVEKRQGYQYEHCFSENWNAMKGYHYLMRLAHFINSIALKSIYLAEKVLVHGVRGLISFIRNTLSGPWLNADHFKVFILKKHQLRME